MAEPKNTDTRTGKRTRGKTPPAAAPLSDEEQRSLSVGIAAMMAFAAALSAPTLYGLARLIGFAAQLAWLLPAALDGYAVTSIWFGRKVSAAHPAAKAARRNARLALALTVACNGLYHLLTLGGVLIPTGARVALLVTVSSLPPFLVDRLLHLRSLAAGNGNTTVAVAVQATPPATGNTAPKATPAAVAPPATLTALPVATPQATSAAQAPSATATAAAKATPTRLAAPTGNVPIRLITAAEKDAIVARMLDERGDDVPLSEIATAIGTKHRATAMKVRDRVIEARAAGEPTSADDHEDAADEPEPALGTAV